MDRHLDDAGLAGEILVHEVVGEGHVALAGLAHLQGRGKLLELGKAVLLTHEVVKSLGCLLLHLFAVDEEGKVYVGELAGLGRSRAVDGGHLGVVLAGLENEGVNFVLGGYAVHLFNLESFVVGQVEDGQMLEGDAVLDALVALEVNNVGDIDLGDGRKANFLHDLVDVHIDQILLGVFVKLTLEAVFDDLGRHVALAEALHGDAALLQLDGHIDGSIDFLRLHGDQHLLFAGRNLFDSIFHGKLLYAVLVRKGGIEPPRQRHWILNPGRLPVPPLSQSKQDTPLAGADQEWIRTPHSLRTPKKREALDWLAPPGIVMGA